LLSFPVSGILRWTSLLVAISGILIIVVAILQLNKNLTPFPSPKENGTLIQTGLYKFVRHPIYSGIILSSIGYGISRGSIWKIGIGMALWVLFFFKSKYEERLLSRHFEEYETYMKKTGRFFPFF
jgi:protein-S-isoprenylcysteine O-methyltransferase Ste14